VVNQVGRDLLALLGTTVNLEREDLMAGMVPLDRKETLDPLQYLVLQVNLAREGLVADRDKQDLMVLRVLREREEAQELQGQVS